MPTKTKTVPAANVASLIYYSIPAVLERERVEVYSTVQSHSEWKSGPQTTAHCIDVTCLN